ncbi:MAG: transposase [Clostridia bacterium]
MTVPTFQDAEVILRLYDQYESDRLRQARIWFDRELGDTDYESFRQRFPQGSDGLLQFRTLYGFFEMVGVLYKNGLVHPDLLFDMWYINGFYARLYPVIEGIRGEGDIHVAENFERLALAELTWIGKEKGEAYVPAVPYADKARKDILTSLQAGGE